MICFIKTGYEFKGRETFGWSLLYWAFVNHISIDCSKILQAIEIIRNAPDSTKSETINYVNTHHSIGKIAKRYKEKLPPSKRFFKIRSEITKDKANGLIEQLGMAAVSAYEGAFLHGPSNQLSISNAAVAVTELIPVHSMKILCPLLESFDSIEEEHGQGFVNWQSSSGIIYLRPKSLSLSVKMSRMWENISSLNKRYYLMYQVSLKGEEAWKKGELEKSKDLSE